MSDFSEIPQDQCTIQQTIIFVCFCLGLVKGLLFLASFLSPIFTRRSNLKKKYGGGWAFVTGGSEGIGLAIAEELAKEGFDIVIVSRSMQKLQAASQKLQAINSKIQVKVKSIDFQKITTEEEYIKALGDILQLDVSILVNNVGYYIPKCFGQISFEDLRREMKINCLSAVVMSHLFLERMGNRKQRSGVINLSSAAAMANYAGCAHYSATKKFMDHFSQCLAYENSSKVDFLTARPFIVSTPMSRNIKSIYTTSAEKCASVIVNSLGSRSICYGPLIHSIQGAGVELLSSELMSLAYTSTIKDYSKLYEAAGK